MCTKRIYSVCSGSVASEPSWQYAIGKPIEVWCKNLYEPYSKNIFIPVDNITCRVMHAHEPIDGEEV